MLLRKCNIGMCRHGASQEPFVRSKIVAKNVRPRKRLQEIRQEIAGIKARLSVLKAEREELRARVKAAAAAKVTQPTEPKV
jgi:hypothetical protein